MCFTTAIALTCLLGLVVALPTQPTDLSSTIAEAFSTPTPAPSTAHLEIRQGVPVTAAPAAAPINAGQVSSITTVQIGVIKDGAYVQVQEVYTQTFALPLDQWPSATQGAIGLGTIQGEIGVVKTKRDLMPTQLPSPPKDVLTLERLRIMMDERPVEDERGIVARDLVLTTAELNKILAAMPVEDPADDEKRNVVITKEFLDKLIN